ncbi:helix-turn-helix transcriptional regulator [Aquimarina sp. 2201CG5-10]|uniref:helix-turn-helix transcriptional regulator n=1 Tax=Aquimarina callyspongiae TaxID=3098150 RepID=UPI002AB32DCE|nr:helix-turn-helix transcriptional regulator [Aquimarina sp. 2201CG5-10]MDY8136918.1 helix-turn-helix transcriptional regulator [Aquimarina sp. 2201CG5-10]
MSNKSDILYETIGNNIKRIRKSKKLGQQELAKKISLSRSSLSNIEIGNHQPSIYTIYEIALALKCQIEDLLPSLKIYTTSTVIDKKYRDIYNSLPENISEKDLNILKGFLKKD